MHETVDGITRAAVESSNLVSVGYNKARQVLAVEFKSGDIFHYTGVDEELATKFLEADSLGAFYSRNIKGKISAMKMTGQCRSCGSSSKGLLGERCATCGDTIIEVDRLHLAEEGTETEVVL